MSGRRPENLLAELSRLESLRASPAIEGENRQFRRFVVRGDAELYPLSRSRLDRGPLDVTLRDIGRGGFGFVAQQPLTPGSNWRVCFLRHGYVVGEQAAIVRHCRRVCEGVYLVGAQFIINTGLLIQLGIDPGAIHDEYTVEDDRNPADLFQPPNDATQPDP